MTEKFRTCPECGSSKLQIELDGWAKVKMIGYGIVEAEENPEDIVMGELLRCSKCSHEFDR